MEFKNVQYNFVDIVLNLVDNDDNCEVLIESDRLNLRERKIFKNEKEAMQYIENILKEVERIDEDLKKLIDFI